jgi:hypothetical protein
VHWQHALSRRYTYVQRCAAFLKVRLSFLCALLLHAAYVAASLLLLDIDQ